MTNSADSVLGNEQNMFKLFSCSKHYLEMVPLSVNETRAPSGSVILKHYFVKSFWSHVLKKTLDLTGLIWFWFFFGWAKPHIAKIKEEQNYKSCLQIMIPKEFIRIKIWEAKEKFFISSGVGPKWYFVVFVMPLVWNYQAMLKKNGLFQEPELGKPVGCLIALELLTILMVNSYFLMNFVIMNETELFPRETLHVKLT